MAAFGWSCPTMGWDLVTIIYLHWWGNMRTLLLERPAVWCWGPRLWLVRVPESQYSAAYSVPWSPLHSSVNSFTISFTLLLFTRSLQDRGRAHFFITCAEEICISATSLVTWVSVVRSCFSALLWPAMRGNQEAAAPPSTTHQAERSSACLGWKALLRTGPWGFEGPRPRCPGGGRMESTD